MALECCEPLRTIRLKASYRIYCPHSKRVESVERWTGRYVCYLCRIGTPSPPIPAPGRSHSYLIKPLPSGADPSNLNDRGRRTTAWFEPAGKDATPPSDFRYSAIKSDNIPPSCHTPLATCQGVAVRWGSNSDLGCGLLMFLPLPPHLGLLPMPKAPAPVSCRSLCVAD